MKSIGYHFYKNKDYVGIYGSNRESCERPLLINCAGNFHTESTFSTDAADGRLDYYLIYLQEGCLHVDLDGEEKICEAGDLIIYPPNKPYKYSHKTYAPLNYFWAHFTGRDVYDILNEYGFSELPYIKSLREGTGTSAKIQKFLDACAKQVKFKEAELALLFERLLLDFARAIYDDADTALKKSITFINSAYNTDIRIPDLARMENLSISRFNYVFKEKMGVSPLEYIIRIRISYACDLLRETNLSVKEISSHIGYPDQHFFSRIFKAHTGMSPNYYRKNI